MVKVHMLIKVAFAVCTVKPIKKQSHKEVQAVGPLIQVLTYFIHIIKGIFSSYANSLHTVYRGSRLRKVVLG